MTAERQRFFLVCGPAYTVEGVPTYPRKQAPNQVYVPREGWRGVNVFVVGETAFSSIRDAARKADANYAAMSPDEIETWLCDQDAIADAAQARRRAAMAAELSA